MLKLADKRLKKLGFTLIEETKYISLWKRYNKEYDFMQELEFQCKANGNHIMLSCDADLGDSKSIGHTCVGLNREELKVCARKMKELEYGLFNW